MWRFKPKFLKNDPGKMVLLMTFKIVLIMVLFLSLGHFLFSFNRTTLIWGCFYLAFAAISCAFGEISQRKKIFIYYTATVIIALWLAALLFPYKTIAIFVIIFFCFIAFWVRRFGEAFIMFPPFVTLIFMISVIQLPIEIERFSSMGLSILLAAIIFYGITLYWLPWDTPRQLKALIHNFALLLYTRARLRFLYPPKSFKDSLRHYRALLEEISLTHDKGERWIINKDRKKHWQHIWSELNTLTRLMRLLIVNVPKMKCTYYRENSHKSIKYILLMIRTMLYDNGNDKLSLYDTKLNEITAQMKTRLFQHSETDNLSIEEATLLHEILFTIQKIPVIISMVNAHVDKL